MRVRVRVRILVTCTHRIPLENTSTSCIDRNCSSPMSYEDPILSQFKNKDAIDAQVISGLIEDARGQAREQSVKLPEDLHGRTLEKCKECLSIYTDLVKLGFLLAKSWDLKTLEQTVKLRFGLVDLVQGGSSTSSSSSTAAVAVPGAVASGTAASGVDAGPNTGQNEGFERDIALKTISKCDKLSIALEQLSMDSREIMHSIQSVLQSNNNNTSVLLSDAMTLLLEIWFLCGRQLRKLKRQVASFFMRSKLLLIDYELELVSTTSLDKMTQANIDALRDTIASYKSFIKVLLQQLSDAEASDNQTEFEECLAIFMDVEGMYQAFSFSWLLNENKAILSHSQESYAKAQQESDMHDLDELSRINSFVDKSLEQGEEEAQEEEEEEEDLVVVQDPLDGDVFEPTPLGTAKLNHSISSNSQGRSRRLSNMSGTSDISLMMEKTSLTKELPHLLQAFDNAKKLANEIESVREHGGSSSPSTLTPIGSPTQSSFLSMDNSTSASTLLNSSFLSNHVGIKTGTMNSSSKILENLAHRQQEFPFASSSPLNPSPLSKLENSQQLIRQDMLKLMSQSPKNVRPSTHPNNIPGFGSNILNNLYGIGSKH